jgi:phage baseplate assembly protein W
MAIEIIKHVLDLDKDIAIGIPLPMNNPAAGAFDSALGTTAGGYASGSVGGGGVFPLTYSTEAQAISNLKNLILTNKGERVMQPELGGDLRKMVFEPNTHTLKAKIEDILGKDIEYWLPYIIVDNIKAKQEYDTYTVKITLDFRVTEAGANRTITIFITPERSYAMEEKTREEFILKPEERGPGSPGQDASFVQDPMQGGYGASMY